MEVFISWSAERSRIVAEALRTWLPSVLQAVEPWLSSADIDAGSRWHQDLGARLSACNFGIICLTPENQSSKWLLYEAGALSKSVEGSRVVPYLVGLRKADVEGPLSHFQAVEAEKEGTFELVRSINVTLATTGGRALPDAILARTYEVWWQELNSSLEAARDIVSAPSVGIGRRDTTEMVVEIVENTRSISRRFESVLERLEPKVEPKIAQPGKSYTPAPEALDAVRKALVELLPSFEGDLPYLNDAMERSLERWKIVAAEKGATFESLNAALYDAKSLRAYLDK